MQRKFTGSQVLTCRRKKEKTQALRNQSNIDLDSTVVVRIFKEKV